MMIEMTINMRTVLSNVNGFENGVSIVKKMKSFVMFGKDFLYLYAIICKYTEFLIISKVLESK